MDMLKGYSFSTTRRVIKNEHWMLYQPERWLKVCYYEATFIYFRILIARTVPKEGWTHHPNGPHMRDGRLPTGETQSFYFPPDHPTMPNWFKGMEVIIRERGLWPAADGLLAQCANFRCPPGQIDCCCRRLL